MQLSWVTLEKQNDAKMLPKFSLVSTLILNWLEVVSPMVKVRVASSVGVVLRSR